jgi:hypothetical protein
MAGNREYKSDVFSMLMEDKRNALELYNAVNGSDYVDPEYIWKVTGADTDSPFCRVLQWAGGPARTV